MNSKPWKQRVGRAPSVHGLPEPDGGAWWVTHAPVDESTSSFFIAYRSQEGDSEWTDVHVCPHPQRTKAQAVQWLYWYAGPTAASALLQRLEDETGASSLYAAEEGRVGSKS